MTARRRFVAALGLTGLGLVPAPVSAQSETVEYYATDAIGSVRVVFDASGAVLGRMDYAPFGQELYQGLFLPSERFAQLTRDGEAGQDYAQARMYLLRSGRFTATDPVFTGTLSPQNWNRYSYTLNNPLRFVDPTGLCVEDDFNVCVHGTPSYATLYWRGLPGILMGNSGVSRIGGAQAGSSGRGGPGAGPVVGSNSDSTTNTNTTTNPNTDPDEGEDWHECSVRLAGNLSWASLLGASPDNWLAQTIGGNDFASVSSLARDLYEGDWTWGSAANTAATHPFPGNLMARSVDVMVHGVGPADVAVGHETSSGHYEVDRFVRRRQPPKAVKAFGYVLKGVSSAKLWYDGIAYGGAVALCLVR